MIKQSLSGSIGVAIFILGFICVCVAFSTPSWLISDDRLNGQPLEKFGLWTHCFRSLGDTPRGDYSQRYFVGCRWIYDPFTAGYDKLRGFLLPPFMIATQFFFTLAFILGMAGFGNVLYYTLCSDSGRKFHIQIIVLIGFLSLAGGACGSIAVIIFASLGNTDGWMPGHENNFFGWSFVIGIVGSVLMIISGTLMIVEANVQTKKRRYLKESQTHFPLEKKP